MKSYIRTFCVILTGLLVTLPKLHAQPYTIDWHKTSGGGGTSTKGQYAVSGAIDQPDAGATMMGGNYSLAGGFWSLIAVVQVVGSPMLIVLHLRQKRHRLVAVAFDGVFGPTESNLATSNWTTSGLTISDDGTNKSITITSPTGNLLFSIKAIKDNCL